MFSTEKIDPLPRTALRLALAGAAIVALTGLAGCANNDMSGMDHGSGGSASAAPSASAPSAASTPADGPHNDADVMFASMMIPHHQQAIEMSDMVLAKDGLDTSVTDPAQQIKDAQAPEIAQMQGWLAGWAANPSPSSMSDMDHGGDETMSQADMDALDQATGSDAARLSSPAWSSTTRARSPWLRRRSPTARARKPRSWPRASPASQRAEMKTFLTDQPNGE